MEQGATRRSLCEEGPGWFCPAGGETGEAVDGAPPPELQRLLGAGRGGVAWSDPLQAGSLTAIYLSSPGLQSSRTAFSPSPGSSSQRGTQTGQAHCCSTPLLLLLLWRSPLAGRKHAWEVFRDSSTLAGGHLVQPLRAVPISWGPEPGRLLCRLPTSSRPPTPAAAWDRCMMCPSLGS